MKIIFLSFVLMLCDCLAETKLCNPMWFTFLFAQYWYFHFSILCQSLQTMSRNFIHGIGAAVQKSLSILASSNGLMIFNSISQSEEGRSIRKPIGNALPFISSMSRVWTNICISDQFIGEKNSLWTEVENWLKNKQMLFLMTRTRFRLS